MGIGMVVWDGTGEVMVTLLAPKEYIVEADIAKVAAALRAIKLGWELGFYKVVLEGDIL